MADKKEKALINKLYEFKVEKTIRGTLLRMIEKECPEKDFCLMASPNIDKNKVLSLKEKLYDCVLNHIKEN